MFKQPQGQDEPFHLESLVQTHQASEGPLHELGAKAGGAETSCEPAKLDWARIVGRIVSFTANPDSISGCLPSENQVRYCGAVLRVEAAPDYKGLPTCLATVRGRSGKQTTINFTECYAMLHDSWAEAERSK